MRRMNSQVNELSWKKLLRADCETISLPFQLTLKDSDKPLFCEHLLRIVPGKRMVVSGTWGEQTVVAKLFYDRDAERHIKRDVEGVKILQEANVPTPALLYQGSASKKRLKLVLFEKIEESASLEQIWQQKESFIEINALLRSFTIELATQHVLGILQRDLHLNNFLVTNKRIYTLDGAEISHVEKPLDKKTSLENLGLFFSQLGVGTKNLQDELFQVYVKARGWLVKKADIDLLQATVKYSWNERWRRYQKKILRTCTAFKKINKLFKTILYDRQYQSPALLNVLQNPDKIFSDPHTEVLKNGRSSTVAKVTIDNTIFVIKRYNLKNSLHWLRRCLRDTRAQNAWQLAQRLRLFGVPTAKPIAFVENHFLGLRGTSYFLMEYLPGKNSSEFFSDKNENTVKYEYIVKRILALLCGLRELHITHGDLKSTNIIIHANCPSLIDLDGMSQHAFSGSFQKAYAKDVRRFMRNWENQPYVAALFQKNLKGFNHDVTQKQNAIL